LLFSVASAIALTSLFAADDPAKKPDEPKPEAKPEAKPDTPAPKLNDGMGEGWRAMTEEDFQHVNDNPDTWSFKDGGIQCTGSPVGVIRTKKIYTNFEMVLEWNHLKHAGNSGVFVWTVESSLEGLKKGALPRGMEVQVLDPGYEENWEKSHNGVPSDWFTSHGDVFAVGVKFTPFPPVSKNGRSFPKERRVKPHGEWNHYYIKAVNGEIRLSVNGVEVSGGKDIEPRSGPLCLESEGSPIHFRNVRIRELP
jgi:hypothetical protein